MAEKATEPLHVLIVDDDGAVRRTHARVLESAGFAVTAVDSGLAAFTELDSRSFRAIVCDHKMPHLDGRNFYEQLEETFPNLASRVVFVTGWTHDSDVGSFLENTGQPVLDKPVESSELIAVVRTLAGKPG